MTLEQIRIEEAEKGYVDEPSSDEEQKEET